jgi:hypothetical protein
MLSFRRLALYSALTLPAAYVMGITFADRRIVYYVIIAMFLAPVFVGYLLHETFRKKWPRYQHFLVRRGWWLRKVTPVLGRIALYVILFLPMAILVPIGVGLTPWPFAGLAAVLLAGLVAQFTFGSDYPRVLRLDLILVMIIGVYAAVGAMAFSFLGTPAQVCDQVALGPFLKPVVTRHDIAADPKIDSCFPYDVKSDEDDDKLFFTLKQARSGFIKLPGGQRIANDGIGATSLSDPNFQNAAMIYIQGASTGRYPQRITVNPERREIYVVVLDINGRHSIWIVGYENAFQVRHVLAVDFEPIRAYFNTATNRLIVLGYEGDVGMYDLDNWDKRMGKRLTDLGFIGMLDTLAPDRYGARYFASVVSRNFLILDSSDLSILHKREIGVPTIGLDYDARRNLVYAAGTLTREIVVLNGDNLEVVDRIPTGTTVRELYLDRTRGLIVTAGYSDGLLDFYDQETRVRRGRIFVGKLARGIHVTGTGRVFVTSSCGLFEVDVDGLLKSGA